MHSQQLFNECIARTGRVSWFRWRRSRLGEKIEVFVRGTAKASVHSIEGAFN